MDFFIFIKLLCCVFLLAKACNSTIVSSPEIRSPFWIDGLDHPNQSSPTGFNLFCRENRTMIHFPTYGDLVVKSISYETRRLGLLDPKNCVHEVFLNLNLSLTPFSYYYDLKQYKYINCSSKLVGSFEQVPCLSGTKHHVYVVESSFSSMPLSCSCVKTVEIPFSYSPYLSDSSFGLGLTWNSIGLENGEEATSSRCTLGFLCERFPMLEKSLKVSALIASIFIVGMLFYATRSRYRKEVNARMVQETLGDQFEIEELLGEYK
ncbi:hypothetical protein ABFS82_01G100600 [Erythranthe guttata]|uniref:RING-type E3 ubiquitin transferase n=1 Tax=Erythranthe guttata TaxID=4155 RepID=A0A022PWS2_ERYGU|nr:PREDICTED: RING-H2 finger protein ATL22-like [Erythranthe guttata]EYU19273.1 hypothetical protein MIMGU_mgv1a012065mg [Erythranthe guttata]|eukprot:XP_012827338.1 PREDICTED: RING-H2 finger protein ATL22-like [Erythranthe guttata]